MAKNYEQEGEVIDFTAGGAAIPAGAIVVMSKRIGVVLGDIPALGTGSVSVTGVWKQNKLASDVIAQGDELYWDDAADRMTKTAGANVMAGYATKAAGAGVDTVSVKINA